MYAIIRVVENGYVVEIYDINDTDDCLVGEYVAQGYYDISNIVRDHMTKKENN